MWSAPTEPGLSRPGTVAPPPWRSRLAPAHALWWARDALWDHGPQGLPWHRSNTRAQPLPHASLAAWADGRRGQAARLWVSSASLHDLLIDPTLPLADEAALLHYARGVLQHYHGDAATAWPLAAWQAAGARGVSAFHAAALADIQASLRQAGVALRSVRPAWTQALAVAARQHPALLQGASTRLLVLEAARFTQIDLAGGRLVGLQHRHLADASEAALADWCARHPVPLCLALGHGLALAPPGNSSPLRHTPGLVVLGTLSSPVPGQGWWANSRRAAPVAP